MSIVPLNAAFAGGGAGGGAAGAGAGTAGRAGAAGAFCAFIMSIVPLNLGAEAPLRLKPHLEQTAAVSGFCVPQFGQNTPHLLRELHFDEKAGAAYSDLRIFLKGKIDPSGSIEHTWLDRVDDAGRDAREQAGHSGPAA